MRDRLYLHGEWKRYFNGRPVDYVTVPGSYYPVGRTECRFSFELPEAFADGDALEYAYYLCTEGVLTEAEFSLNGTPLGQTLAVLPYEFKLPAGLLRPGTNTVSAAINDLASPFGATPGRKFAGGLIRPIFIERRPAAFFEHVVFRYTLNDDFASADCTIKATLSSPTGCAYQLLLDDGAAVAEGALDTDGTDGFRLPRPRLWSPDAPRLYTLRLTSASGDCYEERVGFRKIEVRGQDFYLNGERFILKGVCRHEFTEEHGYAVPEEVVRRDLERIRHHGFNFVRLVHHPHPRITSRLAAEVGLFVTEEPGACWNDLSDEAIVTPLLETLRRIIRRDCNVPSVFAWYIYNECNPDIAYAVKAAALCRELDPDRLIAMADCSGKVDEVKAMVKAADISYYGVNQYSSDPDAFAEMVGNYHDRPFVLTEWGGLLIGQGAAARKLCTALASMTQPDSPVHLSGYSFWCWQDYEERGRGQAGCSVDGVTTEGLIDIEGNEKEILSTLSDMSFLVDHPPRPAVGKVINLRGGIAMDERWQPVVLPALPRQAELAHALQEAIYPPTICRRKGFPAIGTQVIDGIPFVCGNAPCAFPPLLPADGTEMVIPIGREVTALAFLGHAALMGGYPGFSTHIAFARSSGVAPAPYLSPASEYDIVFEDGIHELHPLKHGLQLLRGSHVILEGRFSCEPASGDLVPALRIECDQDFGLFTLYLWRITWEQPKKLREVRWRNLDGTTIQTLAAISCR